MLIAFRQVFVWHPSLVGGVQSLVWTTEGDLPHCMCFPTLSAFFSPGVGVFWWHGVCLLHIVDLMVFDCFIL